MQSFKDAVALSEAADAAIKTAGSQITKLLGSEPALRADFLRLAFYDAILQNPARPKGSIRFSSEARELPPNVKTAISRLEDLRKKDVTVSSYVSYADLYQLAGVEAIKSISGITLPFQHGRPDSCLSIPLDELEKFTLAQQGDDAVIVRTIFYPLGLNDKEIVALFSAIIYTISPSLFTTATSGSIDLCSIYVKLINEFKGKVIPKVNEALNTDASRRNTPPNEAPNSQSNAIPPSAAANFGHWKCLVLDPSFRKHVEDFAKDSNKFLIEYTIAHEKLLELGFRHFPKPIQIDYHEAKHGIAFAVVMTILFGVVGFFYETIRA